jgi:phage tail-like protein
MAVGGSKYPYLAFNYLVEIEGVKRAAFSEVTGLQAEVEVKDYREGGLNDHMHRLPGPIRYPSNLILKYGLTDDDTLWNWYLQVTQGKIVRKNASIVLLDSAREEKRRWNFAQAYPVRWSGPQLRAGTAEVAVETIELVHNGLM